MTLFEHESARVVLHGEDGGACLADVFALASDRDELAALGVVLGRFDPADGCFARCLLTKAAERRLEALGGKYFWVPVPGRRSSRQEKARHGQATIAVH